MSKFRLVQMLPDCSCKEIAYSQNVEQLKASCSDVMKIYPGMEYGIVDDNGYFIWPEKYKDKEPQYNR